MPTYLKYKYIYFFNSISGRIRNIFPAEPDPDPWKKMSDSHPWFGSNPRKNPGSDPRKTDWPHFRGISNEFCNFPREVPRAHNSQHFELW